MRAPRLAALLFTAILAATQACAWGEHTLTTYRAFEKMPEVVGASPVVAESLESFLRSEENTLEALLASQEAWGRANLEKYAARPAALAFLADPARSDEARRLAFISALRLAPNSKFALYYQPDPWNPPSVSNALSHSAVSTQPDPGASPTKFMALKAGDLVSALTVLASATDEPDYGFDIDLWEDSPSEWGKRYGFGAQPFGANGTAYGSQAPFHMGFMHESRMLYLSAPAIKRSYPLLRSHQFYTLSALAFRTGHAYWGWRFAGLSLHYLQELTLPYQSKLAPGEHFAKVLTAQALAMTGFSGVKDELMHLQSNRQLVLQKFQTELLQQNAQSRQEGPLESALRHIDKDRSYPEWSDRYLRDVVSAQACHAAAALSQTMIATLPAQYVSDTTFDFGAKEASINLLGELSKRDAADRAKLEIAVAELMGNLGAHSRNALRGILKASSPP